MRIAKIGTSLLYEGMSTEIFISGCKHNCEGCQNPLLQDFNYGKEMTTYQILEEIAIRRKWIDSIVLTGGDPLWSRKDVLKLIMAIKKEFPTLKIWLYTGFTKEEIDSNRIMAKIFKICDVIVTDRYDSSFPKVKYAGSSNQRMWKNDNRPPERAELGQRA